jgi:hypothetical protein
VVIRSVGIEIELVAPNVAVFSNKQSVDPRRI